LGVLEVGGFVHEGEPYGIGKWRAVEPWTIKVADEERHTNRFTGGHWFEPCHGLGHTREVAVDRLRILAINKEDVMGVLAAGVRPSFVLAAEEIRAEKCTGSFATGEEVGLSERQGNGFTVLGFEEVKRLQATRTGHAIDFRLAERDGILAAAVGRACRGKANK
jgi:hypothetical protein